MAIKQVNTVEDKRKIKNVLISVWDKTGILEFARSLGDVTIYSTGGTFVALAELPNVKRVEEYTGYAEMPGGLVKTLHPKIHAGILADARDLENNDYLEHIEAVHFDMVVANLYPFQEMSVHGVESARSHIDIGGPTMISAAAKNYLKVTVVTDPSDYGRIVEWLKNGHITFTQRVELAKKAWKHLADYQQGISDFFDKKEEFDYELS